MKQLVVWMVLGASAFSGMQASAEATGIFDVAIGKACWIEGYTNTAATWTVSISNGEGVGVVLEGSGVNFAPMAVTGGSARFDVTGSVEAKFKATYGGDEMRSRVKFSNHVILSDSGDPAVFHTIVGGEDGGDDDWQDLVLNVTCLHHAG